MARHFLLRGGALCGIFAVALALPGSAAAAERSGEEGIRVTAWVGVGSENASIPLFAADAATDAAAAGVRSAPADRGMQSLRESGPPISPWAVLLTWLAWVVVPLGLIAYTILHHAGRAPRRPRKANAGTGAARLRKALLGRRRATVPVARTASLR